MTTIREERTRAAWRLSFLPIPAGKTTDERTGRAGRRCFLHLLDRLAIQLQRHPIHVANPSQATRMPVKQADAAIAAAAAAQRNI